MSDAPIPSRVDRRIDVLLDAIAETNRNLNALTSTVGKLADLMDRHLRHDHGYGDDES